MPCASFIVSILALIVSIIAMIRTFRFRTQLLERIEPLEHLKGLPEISTALIRESEQRAETRRESKLEILKQRYTQIEHISSCLGRQINKLPPEPPGAVHGYWLDHEIRQEIQPTIERAQTWLGPDYAELLRTVIETSPSRDRECRTPELRDRLIKVKDQFDTLAKRIADEMGSLEQSKQSQASE